MKRTLMLCLLCLLCALTAMPALPCFAESASQRYVYDDMNALTNAEEARIEESARALSEAYGIDFYAVVTNQYGYNGDRFREEGRHATRHFALLVIVKNGAWYYDLYTYGKAYRRISDSEVNTMLDAPDVYNAIKGGNLCNGILAWQTYAHDACYMASFIPSALLVGGICGVVSCVIVVLVYNKKMKKTNYPLDKYTSLRVTGGNDVFITSHVTSRTVESSSGGSRSGSGGGGGGHRGGR